MSDPVAKRLKLGEEEEVGEEAAGGDDLVDVASVTALEEIQRRLDKVNDEASDKVLAVEQEFNKKRRPIYAERNAIIRNCPHFWQRCLMANQVLHHNVTEDDQMALEYLTELDVEDFEDIKSGFKVVLRFSANPFFGNEVLTKSYHYGDDGNVAVHPAKISWKEGQAPDRVTASNKRRKGPDYQFFDWLASDKLEPEGGTPDAIAEALKEEIWLNPLKWFFAEGDEEDEDEGLEVAEGAAYDNGEMYGEDDVYDDEGEMEALGGDGEGELLEEFEAAAEGEGLGDEDDGGHDDLGEGEGDE